MASLKPPSGSKKLMSGIHYAGSKIAHEDGGFFLDEDADVLYYKGGFNGSRVRIPVSTITDVQIGQEAVRRVAAGRAITLGLLAFAAKKTQGITYIHITTNRNATFSFSTRLSPATVSNALAFIIGTLSMPDAAATVGADDLADQLAKIADLYNSGTLTDEEFAEAKARLIRS